MTQKPQFERNDKLSSGTNSGQKNNSKYNNYAHRKHL